MLDFFFWRTQEDLSYQSSIENDVLDFYPSDYEYEDLNIGESG